MWIRAAVPLLALVFALAPPAAAGELSGPAAEAPLTEELSGEPGAEGPQVLRGRLTRQGIAVDLELRGLRGSHALREGDPVAVRFRITDESTGQPGSRLYPAAWMDRLPPVPEESPGSCRQKVEAFIGGSLLAQPELDLNVYYVLALNDDATISVVDPRFGFGNSKLLTMAFLETPGYDWALTEDQRWLFVSMPASGKVAAVSTIDWKVVTNLEVGPDPGRLAIQPDGKYLWVAYRGRRQGDRTAGVSVIDVAALRLVGHVETGGGDHDLAFDDRGRRAFVTNRSDGTVSAIDTATLTLERTVETAPDPVSISHSAAGQAVYVSHGTSGVVAAIDTRTLALSARLQAEPGLGELRFAPGGRLGLVVNPERNLVHVIDSAVGKIVQTADMKEGPDQVAFSDELAYVRHRGSESVLAIPLEQIGHEGRPVPVVEFPGGQRPPGRTPMPTAAAGIVQAPGARAVLVANPGDKAIFFYKEGMAAPMGQFSNYRRQPRAVQVVDRSLREVEPGVYETVVTLRRPGEYDLALFLDAPRIVHCFDFKVAENPELAAERRRDRQPLGVRFRIDDASGIVGEEVAVRFELLDPVSREPRAGIEDVEVLTFLAPGTWQKRHRAKELSAAQSGEAGGGLYEVRFTPPLAGVYFVFVQAQSQGLGFNRSPYVTLMAATGAGVETAPGQGGPHHD